MKLARWQCISLGLFFLAAPIVPSFVSITTAEEPPSKLVEAKWLEANLSKKNLRIVDVRDSVKDYWAGHIPGSVYLSPDALRWPESGVPVKLIQPAALASLLGEMGIDKKTMVVIYSEKGDYKAPYLVWALDYIGHSDSMVLDGGFSKWKDEGHSVTQDYPKIKSKQYGSPRKLNEEVRATLDEVKEVVNRGGAVLIDVRPVELYIGEKGPWKRKGHIKGAASHFWGEDLQDNGTWKSKQDLRKIYEGLGATPDKSIIVSCGQGQMSAHSYFTLKHILGYPRVKNYDGSFSEWSNIEELPVETGMSEAAMDMSLDGQKLLEERCAVCHNLDRVYKAKKDRVGWGKTVARMVSKGAKLNEAERNAVIEYLLSR